jgi:hypothetical protein
LGPFFVDLLSFCFGSHIVDHLIGICSILKMDLQVAPCGNHEAVGVKPFHSFLNKAVAIAANDCGMDKVLGGASHAAACAWNSSHIDGTNIVHSVPAAGRSSQFPFDLSLSPAPTPTMQQATDVHAAFLRLARKMLRHPS